MIQSYLCSAVACYPSKTNIYLIMGIEMRKRITTEIRIRIRMEIRIRMGIKMKIIKRWG